MNNSTQLLVATTLALTAACGYMLYRVDTVQDRARSDAELIRTQQARIAQLDRERARLQQEIARLQQLAAATPPAPNASAQSTDAAPKPPSRNDSQVAAAEVPSPPSIAARRINRLNTWMQSPRGREAMRAQHRMGLQRMYADFFKQRDMSPEQIEEFITLLSDNSMQLMMQQGDTTDVAQVREAWRERQARINEQLTALLGADGFAEYQKYQTSFGERMEVAQIAEQLDLMRVPLSDDQRKVILDAMIEERERLPRPVFTANTPPEETMQKQVEWREEYDRRVRDRVAYLLSPEQLKHLADYQKWRAEAQQAGLQFSLEMPVPAPRAGARGFAAQPPNGIVALGPPVMMTEGVVVAAPAAPSADP